ncbi:hypothetical protein FC83_GL003005 [Agrilactobacillus composti DSM 18527 = JCM 14202]|uniref:GtrA/DPMS transmembrane domain-containing protein n=1 Tax=Agrilactobacillus composti DSM 18527 = JCM 14202 TaxID=1423734 RepID=X0QN28_9LACO|nr:GtrA family protein [Agrilactobacillus composti]KRM36254.1 hypothetical protein FC83_GL003005 [Agrilactobacillus composti DSM 18527 = JCM 14202]GAF39995.1 teichoic acid glycosylation protein [Agrilactobacillus composti DSM 18527 = JCM 14202]
MLGLIHKYKQLIAYGIFGVLTTVVNIVAYQLFAKYLGINPLVANVIAWFLSVLFAFFTNKTYVFGSKYTTKNAFFKELWAFFGARVASFGIDELCVLIGITWLGLPGLPVKIVDNIIVIVINYVLSKIIFKSDPLAGKKDVQEDKNV